VRGGAEAPRRTRRTVKATRPVHFPDRPKRHFLDQRQEIDLSRFTVWPKAAFTGTGPVPSGLPFIPAGAVAEADGRGPFLAPLGQRSCRSAAPRNY
jgi:hypothetical protein